MRSTSKYFLFYFSFTKYLGFHKAFIRIGILPTTFMVLQIIATSSQSMRTAMNIDQDSCRCSAASHLSWRACSTFSTESSSSMAPLSFSRPSLQARWFDKLFYCEKIVKIHRKWWKSLKKNERGNFPKELIELMLGRFHTLNSRVKRRVLTSNTLMTHYLFLVLSWFHWFIWHCTRLTRGQIHICS